MSISVFAPVAEFHSLRGVRNRSRSISFGNGTHRRNLHWQDIQRISKFEPLGRDRGHATMIWKKGKSNGGKAGSRVDRVFEDRAGLRANDRAKRALQVQTNKGWTKPEKEPSFDSLVSCGP